MLIEAITPESSAALDFTLANLYVQANDYPKAVAQYRQAIRKFPDFQRAQMNLGVVLIQLNQHVEAQKELVRTLELGGENGNIYGLIGYCHLMGENISRSRRPIARPPFSRQTSSTGNSAWPSASCSSRRTASK